MSLAICLRRLAAPLVLVSALAFAVPAASADSGSFTISDAGGGNMTVQAKMTVTNCSPDPEFCGWYAALDERHSSLPCYQDDVLVKGLSGFHTEAKTVNATWTFRPFFPRSARLCLYINSTGDGTQLVAEQLYTVPAGYGRGRSSAYWCEDFPNRAAAQYYLFMYPDDPSLLDIDGNGSACEWLDCPCGAEWIPPEPAPTPPPLVALPPSTSPGPSPECREARTKERKAKQLVDQARWRLQVTFRPAKRARWQQKLTKRKAALRKAKGRVKAAC